MTVITRFAPSPTGSLHIGGARTAIFNWLFARHNKGKFLLRIEDTDQARSTDESLDEILRSMEWLGLNFDDIPIRQSERLEIYREYANKLLDSGKAYRCYVSPEELEQKRKEAQQNGEFFQYKRQWASESAGQDEPFAIRLSTPDHGDIQVHDLLRGIINFDAKEIDDFVILKMDGFPTYNFAVVIDDSLMEITHILRGDDHLINTPKQILIYEAMGFKVPMFAHVSMILGSDKTKLSKRHGATSIEAYRDFGYLPEAMINYLARLGWSYGDEEIFSKEGLIEKFSLENLGKSAAVFNPEKLTWLNTHYLKEKPGKEIAELIIPLMKDKGYNAELDDKLLMIIEQLRDRSKTIIDFVDQSHYFYTDHIEYEKKARDKFLKEDNIPVFKSLIKQLTMLESFDQDSIHKTFEDIMKKTGLKLGKIAQPTRVALTGGTVSPGIFEVMEILGKEKVIDRLNKALSAIGGN
ncbi:MAG: glutamate--tRNA ligase [Thermodesulfobacteriota bacterium]